jgi:hypothetical protein
MSLTVLTDGQIRMLLESLTPDELFSFQSSLKEALHDYSTGTQGIDEAIHQPDRTSVHSSRTGCTTLFMPSCSASGHGIKGWQKRVIKQDPPPLFFCFLQDKPKHALTNIQSSLSRPPKTPTPPHLSPSSPLPAPSLSSLRRARRSACCTPAR